MTEITVTVRKLRKRLQMYKGKNISEPDTCIKFIIPLLTALGWDEDSIIAAPKLEDKTSPDYLLKKEPASSKVLMTVEAKKLDKKLGDKDDLQPIGYSVKVGADWYVLTNGCRWILHRTHPNLLIFDTDLPSDEFENLVSLVSFNSVTSGKLKEHWSRLVAKKALKKIWMGKDVLKRASEEADVPTSLVEEVAKEILSGTPPDGESEWVSVSGKTLKHIKGEQIKALKFGDHEFEVSGWSQALLKFCELVAKKEGKNFDRVLNIKPGHKRKGTRPFFDTNPNLLRAPAEVAGTEVYVETALFPAGLGFLMEKVVSLFNYPKDFVKLKVVKKKR